jgi:hypothetical protein
MGLREFPAALSPALSSTLRDGTENELFEMRSLGPSKVEQLPLRSHCWLGPERSAGAEQLEVLPLHGGWVLAAGCSKLLGSVFDVLFKVKPSSSCLLFLMLEVPWLPAQPKQYPKYRCMAIPRSSGLKPGLRSSRD